MQALRTYLARAPYRWEIVVAANACTDRTEEVVRDLARNDSGVRLVSIAQRGKGAAVNAGVFASRGEVIFLCDADLSMPATRLADFLERIRTSDIVVGSREVMGAQRFDEPIHRHVMGRAFNWFVRRMAVPGIHDTQCGFKAFRRNVAMDIFSTQCIPGFAFDVEILYIARRRGYSLCELGIEWYFNDDSRVRPGIDSLLMFIDVLQIRLWDMLGRYDSSKEELRSSHPWAA